jgi:hypothetical protein
MTLNFKFCLNFLMIDVYVFWLWFVSHIMNH